MPEGLVKWTESMGPEHKAMMGLAKACGVPGCQVPIFLVPPPRKHEAEARFKERLLKVVAGDGADMPKTAPKSDAVHS